MLTIKKTLSSTNIWFQRNCFENPTRRLEINENSYIIDTDSNEINSVEKSINKYRKHPSVLLTKSRLKNIPSFSFNEVGLSEIERELNLINPRNATTSNGIPTKLLKSTKIICYETLKTIFNNCFIEAEFPNELKPADATTILKKKILPWLRSTSLLVFFPVYQKSLKEYYTGWWVHMLFIFIQFLSTFMCCYRKGFGTQQALMSLIERWKNTLD